MYEEKALELGNQRKKSAGRPMGNWESVRDTSFQRRGLQGGEKNRLLSDERQNLTVRHLKNGLQESKTRVWRPRLITAR